MPQVSILAPQKGVAVPRWSIQPLKKGICSASKDDPYSAKGSFGTSKDYPTSIRRGCGVSKGNLSSAKEVTVPRWSIQPQKKEFAVLPKTILSPQKGGCKSSYLSKNSLIDFPISVRLISSMVTFSGIAF